MNYYVIVIINCGKNKFNLSVGFYICKDCFFTFCKIPSMCRYCAQFIINDAFINLLKLHDTKYEIINHNFISLRNLYDCKMEEGFTNNFMIIFLDLLRNYKLSKISKKDSIMAVDDDKSLSIVHKIKAYILYLKYIGGKFIYSYIDKDTFNNDLSTFITKNINTTLKESIICTGCDAFIDKSQLNNISSYDTYYICKTCKEISCR